MKKLMIALAMCLLFASPAWAVGHQDILNEAQTTTAWSIAGYTATVTAEANVTTNDNLNKQEILDAIAALPNIGGIIGVPAACDGHRIGGEYVFPTVENGNVICNERTGSRFLRDLEMTGVAAGFSITTRAEGDAYCMSKATTLGVVDAISYSMATADVAFQLFDHAGGPLGQLDPTTGLPVFINSPDQGANSPDILLKLLGPNISYVWDTTDATVTKVTEPVGPGHHVLCVLP